MKRSLHHRWHRLFRRRGGLPRTARVARTSYDGSAARGAFGRPHMGARELSDRRRSWVRRLALAAGAVAVVWVLWQSWIGLGIFGN
jgi:ferric-dicitrate binding protein FerR (iron transport regulator)